LNTGTTELNFYVVIPSNKSITSVIDLDAFNADLTSSYVNTGTITVNDAGGTPFTYKVYRMTNAVTYTASHRHSVTLN
jgi:hypothetical protein